MTAWLTPEWFDEACRLGADCPERPGLSGTVECELTGGPQRSVPCHFVVESGHPANAAAGRAEAPDLSLTVSWEDGAALVTGALDPSVAFMQGRLKVGGSMDLWLGLLPVTSSEPYREFCRRLAAVTEF